MRTESFSVEGEDADGRLRLIGYTDESGRPLNPVATLAEAQALFAEINAAVLASPTVWKNVRIIKTTTTREFV